MKTLEQIANHYATDKRESDHNYTVHYQDYFESLRFEKLNVVEIGILNHPNKASRPFEGASILLWKEYFENSTIHGIDINDHSGLTQDRVNIYIADQGNRNQLDDVFKNFEADIIIDDGSHYMHHQQISFGHLFKYLKSGGLYIIEDLHTSHPKPPFPPLGFQLSENDTRTLDMLQEYCESKKIESIFMNDSEIKYLEDNIDFCDIRMGRESEIAFIRKK
jgi:hypothetical protein